MCLAFEASDCASRNTGARQVGFYPTEVKATRQGRSGASGAGPQRKAKMQKVFGLAILLHEQPKGIEG